MMMDDPNNPYRDSFEEPTAHTKRSSNVLGIVGFVLAFCLPPIGLVLSVIASFKPPRAFAIAGIVVGLLGTALAAMVVLTFVRFGGTIFQGMEMMTDMTQVRQAITGYAASNSNAAPPDLKALQLPTEFTEDPWGHEYLYTPGQGGAWTLRSAGPDGAPDTADDYAIDSTMDESGITNGLGEWWKDRMENAASGTSP